MIQSRMFCFLSRIFSYQFCFKIFYRCCQWNGLWLLQLVFHSDFVCVVVHFDTCVHLIETEMCVFNETRNFVWNLKLCVFLKDNSNYKLIIITNNKNRVVGCGPIRTLCGKLCNEKKMSMKLKKCRCIGFLLLFYLLISVKITPRSADAGESSLPPLIEIRVGSRRWCWYLVQHGAESAKEIGVYKLASLLPFKVFVVQSVIFIKHVQKICHFFGRCEIIDVDERVFRRVLFVIGPRSPHHHR